MVIWGQPQQQISWGLQVVWLSWKLVLFQILLEITGELSASVLVNRRKGFQPEKGRAVRTLFRHAWALSDLCVWGAVIWGWGELFGRSACNNN